MKRLALLPLVLAMLVTLAPPAAATKTIVGGDCWRPKTPLWCRGTWQEGHKLNVYAIDHFSDARPKWKTAFHRSNRSWTRAYGPQVVRTTRAPHDTWIYYEDSRTGHDALYPGAYGITWNCDKAGSCTYLWRSMDVWYSSVKLNKSELPNNSSRLVQGVIAHETGHALGLAHSSRTSELMYPAAGDGIPYKPRLKYDSGVTPPCKGSPSTKSNSKAGVRCVYKWS